MPPRIVTILGRLRQDLAAELSPDAIEQACQEEKYSWRDRVLNPVDHGLLVPPPDPPRQHRLSARRPLRPMELHRQRLLRRAEAAPPGGPPSPRRRRSPQRVRTAATAASTWHRAPGLAPRRVELLDARHPRVAGGVRPARRPAEGVRVPGRQVPGAVRPGHRHAPARRAGAAAVARDVAVRGGHRRACSPATSCSATAASAPTPTSPSSSTASCTGCSACTSVRSSTSHRAGPRAAGEGQEARRGDDPAALAVGAVAGRSRIRSSSGPSPRVSRGGCRRRSTRRCPRRSRCASCATRSTRRDTGWAR